MFDLHAPILDKYGEEIDGDRLADYINELMKEFAESPEGQAYIESYDDNWRLPLFMDYAASYFGATVATISVRETEEILFDIFPRKLSTEPENAGAIVAEQRAFWQYLKRTRHLPQADKVLALLTDEAADELEEMLADEGNFGIAKSFVMAGMAAGFDMQSEKEINAFMALYNASLAGKSLRPDHSSLPEDEPEDDWEPSFAVAPIHKEEPRVGRNDACPCGSGRKYKKCCGAS